MDVVRYCPIAKMTLCVTSDPEMDKCIKMKVTLHKYIHINFFVINFIFMCNSWH